MDWSLVLASQDIRATILRAAEANRWLLTVDLPNHSRALEAIKLYRLENRGWSWRRELPGAPLHFHFASVLWCLALVLFHYAASYAVAQMDTAGRMDSLLVRKGEWWRVFTAITLHGDFAHLMFNVTFGVVMLGLAMGRFGAGVALLATFLAGAIGNLAGLELYAHPYKGLGSSGMMMGALGLVTVHSLAMWKKSRSAFRYVAGAVSGGVFLFLLFGTDPSSDVVAHVGGFVGGMALGGAMAFFNTESRWYRVANALCLILFAAALAACWGLALGWKPHR